ncbi:MAG TPA: tetratricopeptide repeat protein [Lacunisphaera sp.]|nr:tetratricopeptide repeat protein [Lacunisphaera sp.]
MLLERLRAARDEIRDPARDAGAVRRLARLYHANGHYEQAKQCYELIERRAVGLTAQDHYFIADIALNLGDLAVAETRLREVLAHEPAYVPAHLAMARARLKSGQADAAEQGFATVLEREPNHIEATVNLARLAVARGDDEAAATRLEELVAVRPEATSAFALLAQLVERRGDADRAVALRELSQQRPEPASADPWMRELDADIHDMRLLGLRFEEHMRSNQMEAANVFLRRIEEIEPGTPVVHLLQGAAAAQARRHEDAVKHFQAALDRGGDPERICPVLVSSLLALDQTEAALKLMAEHHARQPASIPLTVAYSEVMLKRKDHPHARAILSLVLGQQPYLVPQNVALAEILWAEGKHDLAADCLRRVALVDARHLAARALLGEYHLRRSDPASALPVLTEARALASTTPAARRQIELSLVGAHLMAARRALQENEPRTALQHVDQALEVSPREPEVHAGRAEVFARLGNLDGAAEALRRLADLLPGNPTVLLSLGDVRLQQGRSDLAIRHWSEARELVAPGDHALRAAVDQRLGPLAATEGSP